MVSFEGAFQLCVSLVAKALASSLIFFSQSDENEQITALAATNREQNEGSKDQKSRSGQKV